ncbi:amidohydrolase family protein [Phaeobacter gallaeciensis]|uniref:Metal-dependent hydrolase of the TIM-barrel fold protein n=1 Tax=Phaeobacter gallaeciensis TaxID=60890 RepID=A0AAD0EC80_9RHOB|nr:amidohydrolase family protein [Phaeobacter gallaeciensis]AHD08855.1 putative metal-dependent hydrolase of the TIM-barrel fold protein [Phaeobacter gallaeciensis DSM 26640]ATE92121.1 putative metal-dependent hydrolase of the TIM-barrel fold protein [Phaeobacter gallaeciensis]ATE98060.1 putative metal-dependent hydrolase of the TIM-barrel fold protein [Phaeobacter gallaeciensis]ATF00732.1 putative metal-dependent hydrolase of the TIM-barrel fold protein [Phaeobacter gallaeciensis]ATF05163.1 p
MVHFDCHAHVYEKITATPGARYVPKSPAPLEVWKNNLSEHGFTGGVIVQVSFLGTDNSELCSALSKLDKTRFAGVGVVDLDVDDAELDQLVTAGIRGIRWNLVRGKAVPDVTQPVVQAFFQKLRARGLHLEVHLEGPRLAPHLSSLIDQGINLVIDHYGLPSDPRPDADPFINAVKVLPTRCNLYLKFAAHYRTNFSVTPHAKALLDLLDDNRVVWGSDWPHTQHEASTRYTDTFQAFPQARDFLDSTAAEALYGISIE